MKLELYQQIFEKYSQVSNFVKIRRVLAEFSFFMRTFRPDETNSRRWSFYERS